MTANHDEAIVRHCEQLVIRAGYYTDLCEWQQLAALFVADGQLVRPSDPTNPLVGRAAILASLLKRPARTTRHTFSNLRVDLRSASTAHVSSTVVLFTGPAAAVLPVAGQKILVGNFEDDAVLTPDGWLFVKRDGSMALEFGPF